MTSEPPDSPTHDTAAFPTAGPPRPVAVVSTATDRALIRAVADGDAGAFESLYDRHAGTLLALARRILGDTAAADEIVVDAFTKVWRAANRYDAERSSVGAWLTTIVRSRAIDQLRARRASDSNRLTEVGVAPSTSRSIADGEHSASRSGVRAHISRALAELQEGERRAIELALYGGLTHSEIAKALGEESGVIRTRIQSGMQKLKTMLEPLDMDVLA